ncbi:STAS domain-containing protein [Actinomadura opuntiae]|uniref:STAS domain-containing protein n=1 Tax=Actinomadura sp. OS1-43 TaxID=604315 RepID=UPI00255ADEBD|nr:STAS domain-containing protein [Actinomadura sp. OS1-43]MDL4820229.1 STAS domain-containing protein [Actinomadura sp. OS1-43]
MREPFVLVLAPPLRRGDIPRLCASLAAALDPREPRPAYCDVGTVAEPDMVTVDALLRLHLTARRKGHRLRFRNAGPALRALLSLTGFSTMLAVDGADDG